MTYTTFLQGRVGISVLPWDLSMLGSGVMPSSPPSTLFLLVTVKIFLFVLGVSKTSQCWALL